MLTLEEFDPQQFLAEYWQKKPVLYRQALPGFTTVISPEELAGLACEEGVHSRMVIEKDADKPWQLSYGPFKEEDFLNLPQTHYSLLVSECEKWLPELQELLNCFNFIPRWRLDDLMISYAPEHGSVGPHIDDYDVFLVQANGKRRWSIIETITENPEQVEGIDLALMKYFEADQEWILEPGDMLYLPPKIPHHGVAVGDGCMTYSVGYRAPTFGAMIDAIMQQASQQGITEKRYSDPSLQPRTEPFSIAQDDIEQAKAVVRSFLDQCDELWPEALGCLSSDVTPANDIQGIELESFDQAFEYQWQHHPDSKLFYHRAAELTLFCNGTHHKLPNTGEAHSLCRALCEQESIDFNDLEITADLHELLLGMINQFVLIPNE